MKAKELIEILQKVNPNTLVVVSSDSEGNHYSELTGYDDNAVYTKDGEVGLAKLTPSLEQRGFTFEDVKKGKNCIVLYP